MIAALMDGARIVGNEFNIIAGNYYRTLEQFERRIREYPGLTDFRMELGVPHIQGDGALVDVRASWRLDGKPGRLECKRGAEEDTRIPLRVNKGMGVDAVLGKAKRKFLARLLDYLDGTSFECDEAPAADGTIQAGYTVLPPPGEGTAAGTAADEAGSARADESEPPSPAKNDRGGTQANQGDEFDALAFELAQAPDLVECQRLGEAWMKPAVRSPNNSAWPNWSRGERTKSAGRAASEAIIGTGKSRPNSRLGESGIRATGHVTPQLSEREQRC